MYFFKYIIQLMCQNTYDPSKLQEFKIKIKDLRIFSYTFKANASDEWLHENTLFTS